MKKNSFQGEVECLLTVVVRGNGRQDQSELQEKVDQALTQAKVDYAVLSGTRTPARATLNKLTAQAEPLAEPSAVKYSLILPVYNEQETLVELYHRVTKVMDSLGESYELVFVNDGSQDRSSELLREFHAENPERVQGIILTRNFGHQRAISAGLDHARGQAVIVMDTDLQDPPEVIPLFIEKWQQGFQVVYAIREKRKENLLKRFIYRTFYLVLRSIARVDIPLEAGDFCLMDRSVVDTINALPERNRFVRGLRSWVGYRQFGLAYERHSRFAGKSKYTFRRLMSLAMDGLISFSYLPLRLATMFGFGVSIISLLGAAYYVVRKLTTGLGPPGFATQVVLIAFLGGVQLITVGVIGEYIGHILDEVKGRPAYIVGEVLESNPAPNEEEVLFAKAENPDIG